MTDITRLPLGLIEPHAAPLTDDLMAYATAPLPTPPASIPVPTNDWNVACNDRLGCCVIAGEVHELMLWGIQTKAPFAYPGDPAVESEYFGESGGADTGLIIVNALEHFRTIGAFGHKIKAHAPIKPTNSANVRLGIAWYGVVKTGVQLPMPAQEQFQAGQIWDLTGSPDDYDIEGGHDIEAVGYNETGPVYLSWGRPVQATWRWHFTYATECHGIIPDDYNAFGGNGTIDEAALVADLPKVSA